MKSREKSQIGFRILLLSVSVLIAANDLPHAATGRTGQLANSRPAGEPIMAIVSLSEQRITVYDDKGAIMQAPVSSGQRGRETPAGIFSVLQKDADHYSNMYDDAYMPHMQRLTWSGIALHGGSLPGYPASHGCIRMPYAFAEALFGVTKLGLRVIVAPGDASPAPIEHPALIQPKTGAAAIAAAAAAATARAAAEKAGQARLLAGAAYREWTHAMVPVRKAQTMKLKAEWDLAAAERAIAAPASPEAKQQAEDAKGKALARLAELDVQLTAGNADLQPKLSAMTAARQAASEADAAAAREATTAAERARDLAPVSIFVSRKTQRLYVRQGRKPVLEVPVTIDDADRPIGTHVFTAIERTSSGIRWSVVSLNHNDRGERSRRLPRKGARAELAMPRPMGAAAALDRITIPQDARDFIAERMWPRSSFIISDEALSAETGEDTEFVIVLSGEPQGGLKHRTSSPRVGGADGAYWSRF
jgi:lipoprotein-anchoring transpeptidase ErfK/SrfK